jgi:hypothetical protein
MKYQRTAIAAALCGAMALPGIASAITVDGITFSAGAIFETISLFEGEDVRTNCAGGVVGGAPIAGYTGNCNGFIDMVGESLLGVGRVNAVVDGTTLNNTWINGQNGKEVALYFHSYLAESITPNANGTVTILFSGGVVDLYSQAFGTFSATAGGTQAGAVASATVGNLWLALAGSPIGGLGPSGDPITLRSDAGSLSGTGADVDGRGQLDVTGGLTQSFFDTNGFGCLAGDGAPCPDDSDKSFTSSGQLSTTFGVTQNIWAFIGTGEVQNNSVVPEPGSLALLGLGLAVLGGLARRKSQVTLSV